MLNTIYVYIVNSSSDSTRKYDRVIIDAKNIKIVKDLRDAIATTCGFEQNSFRIVFAGKPLDDESLSVIYDYRMQDETTIYVVPKRKDASH